MYNKFNHFAPFNLAYMAFEEVSIYWKKRKRKRKENYKQWVPISSIGKVSNGCIKDLGFNPRLHKKLIGVLV